MSLKRSIPIKGLDFVAKSLAFLLVVQFVIFLWFTGAIVRNEQSPYVWVEYSKHLSRFGTGEAIFAASLYLLYYGFFIEVPALFLWDLRDRGKIAAKSYEPVICGLWALFTFLLFASSIAQFLRHVPTEVMNGWAVIGWIALTVFVGRRLLHLIGARLKQYRAAYEGRFGLQLDRYEEFLLRHNLLDQFFEEESSQKRSVQSSVSDGEPKR